MTVRTSAFPFADMYHQWGSNLGPAWIEVMGRGTNFSASVDLDEGIRRFVRTALSMTGPDLVYGTVYARKLDGGRVTDGEWHYDLGEFAPGRGAARFVGTWASDRYPLQNLFIFSGEHKMQPRNNYVVAFDEGIDLHRRLSSPLRPGATGVFISMALYRQDEPANLDCPALEPLRFQGHRAIQAKDHVPVVRKTY